MERRKLNGLDLFSGIGGIALALDSWVWPLAYCERDRYCQAVLLSRMREGRMPVAPIWDDVRTLKGCNIPPVDIVTGGFPCQDISVAGNGAGLAGERSGLFFEIVRLVSELRPRFVFLENVPAIVVRGLDRVLLEFTALGYDCRWTVVSAAEVGASHIRERWFLLAHSNSQTLRIEQGRGSGSSRKSEAFDPPDGDVGIAPWTSEGGFESRVFGTSYGVPFALDRDRAIGNAVVPLQAKTAFQRLIGINSN